MVAAQGSMATGPGAQNGHGIMVSGEGKGFSEELDTCPFNCWYIATTSDPSATSTRFESNGW